VGTKANSMAQGEEKAFSLGRMPLEKLQLSF